MGYTRDLVGDAAVVELREHYLRSYRGGPHANTEPKVYTRQARHKGKPRQIPKGVPEGKTFSFLWVLGFLNAGVGIYYHWPHWLPLDHDLPCQVPLELATGLRDSCTGSFAGTPGGRGGAGVFGIPTGLGDQFLRCIS